MVEKTVQSADLALGESISSHHKNGAYAWFVAFCVLFASLAYGHDIPRRFARYGEHHRVLRQDTVWGGSLSSVMGMISAIIVIPFGALITKFSCKWTAVAGLALIAAGAFLAAGATDAGLFYVWRCVQGFGYGIMSVVGATMITRWFDEEHRGLPMGIYGANVGLGGFVINFVANPLMATWNWQGLFWFVAIWALVSVVMYAVFVQDWPAEGKTVEEKQQPVEKAKFTDTFKKPAIWIMALVFLLMGCGQQGVGVFIPMILTQISGATPEQANIMNSAISISVILCTIIAGAIYGFVTRNHKDKRGLLLFVLVIVGGAAQLGTVVIPSDYFTSWVACLFFGLCGTMWMPGMYILVPSIRDLRPSLRWV